MENYETTQDERLWGMLSYLLTFFGFLSFLGPLVVYVVKKGQSRFVAFHALQALLVEVILTAGSMLTWLFYRDFPPILLLYVVLMTASFVYTVLGAIKAWDSEWYQIPLIGGFALRQSGVNRSDEGAA